MTELPRKFDPRPLRRDVFVASCCGALVVGMVGAAYAAVPLYTWFCKTTGFGGTTQVSEKAPDHVLDRTLTIRFDSNVAPGLPWKFVPEQNEIQVRIVMIYDPELPRRLIAAFGEVMKAEEEVEPPENMTHRG